MAQQVGVGVLLVLQLAEDRGTSQPQVLVHRPLPDDRGRLRSVGGEDAADVVAGQVVHQVPPRTGDHQTAIEP